MKAQKVDKKAGLMPAQANVPRSFGPDSKFPDAVPNAVRKFIHRSSQYVERLRLFDQYLVWRYTIGSASINTHRIMGKVTNMSNAGYWCYLFFLYWKNTLALTEEKNARIPHRFQEWRNFFEDPASFRSSGAINSEETVVAIITAFTDALQRIVLDAPPVKKAFYVYKVASDYPGLPSDASDVPKTVRQLPFNSTTINPHFNFAFFLQPDATGNLFHLSLPVGARVLYIPAEFHAYPFEQEILLPYGVEFTITGVYTGKLSVVDKESVNLARLQDTASTIAMGPVYDITPYKPCKETECVVKERDFRIFSAVFANGTK